MYKDVNTHTLRAGELRGVSGTQPRGTSTDTKIRRLTLSGRFLFLAVTALEACCPLSLFQAWLSCMLMDITFGETKPCHYNDFNGTAGCLVGWWDKTLKENAYPGPPRCCQTAAVTQEDTFEYHTYVLKARFNCMGAAILFAMKRNKIK